MNGVEVALASLGIMATVIAALVWLLKKLFTQGDTTLKEGNKANVALANSIDRLATASEEQIRSGRERDVEQIKFQKLVLKQLKTLDEKADLVIEATTNVTVGTQHVQNQVVQTEVVETKK